MVVVVAVAVEVKVEVVVDVMVEVVAAVDTWRARVVATRSELTCRFR